MNANETESHTADIRNTAAQVGENLRDLGGQVRDAAHDKYNRLSEEARAYYNRGRDAATNLESSFEDCVRDKPLQSVLIAAGIGLLVGVLWKRR